MNIPRTIFELSLKPFQDLSDEGIRKVCREILRQRDPLVRNSDHISFLLWSADGSEILDYRGRMEDEFCWAQWIVGATFDPGPEFAESPFKYQRHPEISMGDTMGSGQWVHCAARLHADPQAYAGFPDGIAEDTSLGTFLGRQSRHFLSDLQFDYLWFSNGFGFALSAWSVTGEVFDGKRFDTAGAPRVRDAILQFWCDFRAACPDIPVETRGSNLSTAMDLSSDASPVREIYRGGFNLLAPPNSPWAALNGDYGLELVGWMSHIAELPDGAPSFPFRYYLHDPWWLNSPWLDRYGREPHDIYLPLALARLDAECGVCRPASLALLTIDDSYGRMPPEVAYETTPHFLTAWKNLPDAPGLLTWVYPFDELHDMTFGSNPRVAEVFFGDWFIRSAVNQGFPLGGVISTRNLAACVEKKPDVLLSTILVSPVPEAGTAWEKALLTHLNQGGRVLLYGPLPPVQGELARSLGLVSAESRDGILLFTTTWAPDALDSDSYAGQLQVRPLLCGGGLSETMPKPSSEVSVTAHVGDRIFGVQRDWTGGGRLAWCRGVLSESLGGMLPHRDDPREFFPAERLMRWALDYFGVCIRFDKPSALTRDPLVLASRCRNA